MRGKRALEKASVGHRLHRTREMREIRAKEGRGAPALLSAETGETPNLPCLA